MLVLLVSNKYVKTLIKFKILLQVEHINIKY